MIHRIGPIGLEAKRLETLGIQNKQKSSFEDFLKNAIHDQISTTNQLIKEGDRLGIDFALGKVDNIAEVMTAQEIASTTLQYTVQLRNSFLEAYNEIMRIQV